MRSSTFYPTRAVSCVVLLLLLMNAFSAWAQKITPYTTTVNNTTISGTCMGRNGTATYTFNPANATEVPAWSTRGDIRIVSTSGNTVTIASTTEMVRGVSDITYGKGRLYVKYGATDCGPQVAYVDVFKTFGITEDKIIGPNCVLPDEVVTYSIESYLSRNIGAEIGIDKFKWVVPTGWTVEYYSNDTSSITLRTPATFMVGSSFEIKVYAGRCNTPIDLGGTNTGTGTVYSKPIFQKPRKPELVSVPSCIATNSTLPLTLEVLNPEQGVTYTWVLPSNWQFAAGFDKNNHKVNIVIDNLTGEVKLVAERQGTSCGPVESIFKINRSIPSGSAISGVTCVAGNVDSEYTLTNAPNNGQFKWTFTPNANNVGVPFDATQTGQKVKVQVGSTGGTLSVTNALCPGDPVFTLPIKSIPIPLAGKIINGVTCVTQGVLNQYTIDPIPGATHYVWTLTGGLTFSNGTKTFTGTPTTGGLAVSVRGGLNGGAISVIGTNGVPGALGTCMDDKKKLELLVAVSPRTPNVTADNFCFNAGVAMSRQFKIASPVTGQTYTWQMTNAATGAVTTDWTLSSTTTNGVTATFSTPGANGRYIVQARASVAGCTAASAWGSSLVLGPQPLAELRVGLSSGGGDEVQVWNTTDDSGVFPAGTEFQWSKNGTPLAYPPNTRLILLERAGNGELDTYCVRVTNGNCGVPQEDCIQSWFDDSDAAPQDKNAARVSTGQTASPETELSRQVSVYPNPSNGEFTLTLPAFKGQAQVALKTLQGRTVFRKEVGQQQSKLAPGKLTTGVYLLQVTLDGKTVTKKVQIQK